MSENIPYNPGQYNKDEKVNVTPQTNVPDFKYRSSRGHIWIGIFFLIAGSLFLLSRLGFNFPDFLFSWQMFLIALGIYVGIRKDFQGASWLILILIGSLFLINEFFVFGELRRFILPIILIGSGLFFIFRPKKNYPYLPDDKMRSGETNWKDYASADSNVKPSHDEFVDATSIFGGTKKKIFSKNFRGGDMVNIFGGSEIDLTQADINGTAVLEVTTLFGGATLLVPSHWNVVSDAVAILGEVKDKRVIQNAPENNNKMLLIKGTVIFGGIDVKSY